MDDRNRDVRRWRRCGGRPLAAAAAVALLCVGVTAAPAQADSNFERGFEDQMGRILAYEAVNLGKQVLFQGVVHPAVYGSTHGHGYQQSAVYTAQPTVIHHYRPVPVHTHQHGKRPVRWSRHDDHRPGRHLGHHKQHGRDGWRRHDRHGHDRSCGHRH